MAAVRTRPANRPEIPADALDAMPIFKDKPATDEEREQCTRQLSAQVGGNICHKYVMCSSMYWHLYNVLTHVRLHC